MPIFVEYRIQMLVIIIWSLVYLNWWLECGTCNTWWYLNDLEWKYGGPKGSYKAGSCTVVLLRFLLFFFFFFKPWIDLIAMATGYLGHSFCIIQICNGHFFFFFFLIPHCTCSQKMVLGVVSNLQPLNGHHVSKRIRESCVQNTVASDTCMPC